MWLDVLDPKHYEALYEIQKRAEAYMPPATYTEFVNSMKVREGFVVVRKDGKLAGAISFSNYEPGMDIIIHCFMDPDYKGRWVSRDLYKTGFDFPFVTLGLPRVSGFAIDGGGEAAGRFLLALGFKEEGVIRSRFKTADGLLRDVHIYGMLKEERRW